MKVRCPSFSARSVRARQVIVLWKRQTPSCVTDLLFVFAIKLIGDVHKAMAGLTSLASALRDIATPAGRLHAAGAVENHVYGASEPGHAASWRPRTYAENKSRWRHGGAAASKRSAQERLSHCRGRLSLCRYLWTDAFGVVNYITLAAETGQRVYLDQAAALITGRLGGAL